jgi:hypothetical protein
MFLRRRWLAAQPPTISSSPKTIYIIVILSEAKNLIRFVEQVLNKLLTLIDVEIILA